MRSNRMLMYCLLGMLAPGGPGGLTAAPAEPPAAPLRQVTHSINMDPSLSPDGSRMVYVSVVAGREQLFIADIDGSHSKQITHDDFDHEDPAWSPDGRRIAFVSLAGGGEVITLIGPDGTGAEALTPVDVRAIHPNWTPDSRRVAYCTDDDLHPPAKNASEIDIIDVATRQVTRVIAGGVNTYPSVSPDGRRIAFRRILGDKNSEVFIANANGSDPRNLTQDPAFDGWPSWSPDGTQLVFASNRGGDYKVYVMQADGRDVRRVAETQGRATAPVWAKDGHSIYFPVCRTVDAGADCQIFVAPAPAANATMQD
jgi:TolB protein